MDFLTIFFQMVALAIPIALGYAANKFGLMGTEFDRKLSRLVFNITLPALVVSSVGTGDGLPDLPTICELLGFAAVSYVIALALAFAACKIMRCPQNVSGIYAFAIAFGNVGFIGYPVLTAIYGPSALLYAAIANISNSLFVFSLGVALIARSGGAEASIGKCLADAFKSPALISCLVLLALVLLGIDNLGVLGDGLEFVGNMTTPAALLLTGSSLASCELSSLFTDWRAYVTTLLRLVVVPLVLLVCFKPLVTDNYVLGILVVGSAMPVATNSVLYSLLYRVDVRPATRMIFLTVIASVVTIPLMAMIVG